MTRHVPPVKSAQLVRTGASRVWEALTTSPGLAAWFSTRALVDLRPGGFIHFRWKDWGPEKYTGDARCDLEAFAARKRLAFAWTSHPRGPRTRVEFRLEARGPITLVRVEETGFGTDVQGALDNSVGWGAALVLLKVYLEHGIAHDGRRVDARRPSSRRR